MPLVLRSTVKAADGVPWAAMLNRFTLIVGPNGGGKTAIRQALELAGDGEVTGHLGRATVKAPGLLQDLFAFGAKRIALVGESADGSDGGPTLCAWEQVYDEKAKKWKAPTRSGAAFRFPVREVEAALAGDLSKVDSSARRAFTGWACGALDAEYVCAQATRGLSSAESARFEDIWEAMAPKNPRPIDTLLAVLDYTRAAVKRLASEAEGARVAAAAVLAASAAPPAETPLPDYPYDAALVLLDHAAATEGDTFCPVCGAGPEHEVTRDHLASVIAWAEEGLRGVGIDPGGPGKRPFLPRGAPVVRSAPSAAQDAAEELLREEAATKALAEKLHAVVGWLLDEGRGAFCARVNRYVPRGWQMDVSLGEGFRVGLRRSLERFDTALSGAEMEVVKCAIAAAIVEGDDRAILTPGDRAWDPRTLRAFLTGLRDSPFTGTVVVESTIDPEGGPPEGWTVIDLDMSKAMVAVPTLPTLPLRPPKPTVGPRAAVGASAAPSAAAPDYARLGTQAPPTALQNAPVALPAPAAPVAPSMPSATPAAPSASAWTLSRLREYAASEGRRAIKTLHKELVGKPASAAWDDAATVQAIAAHLGLVEAGSAVGVTAPPAAASASTLPVPPKPSSKAVEAPTPPAVAVAAPAPSAAPVALPAPSTPAPTNGLSLAYRRVLAAMGYDEDSINRLAVADARKILSEGLEPESYEVTADGRVRPRTQAEA